jgi:predicted amidophosphoribosyltransferase
MFRVDAQRGLLRPPRCLACGAPEAWPCCAVCLPPEPAAVGPWAPGAVGPWVPAAVGPWVPGAVGPWVPGTVGPWVLAADPDLPVWTLGLYRDGLRTAVLAGKLDGQPAALTELGRRLGTHLADAGAGADLVTYVAASRVAGPPRDHAQRIAAGVATALDLPLADLLAPAGGPDLGRARRSRPDQSPPPRPPPRPRRRLLGGRVLLIDDLTTTGGTLAGAAASLRDAGARTVEAAVLAASPSALRPDAGRFVRPRGSRLVPPHRGPPRPPHRGLPRPPPRAPPTARGLPRLPASPTARVPPTEPCPALSRPGTAARLPLRVLPACRP